MHMLTETEINPVDTQSPDDTPGNIIECTTVNFHRMTRVIYSDRPNEIINVVISGYLQPNHLASDQENIITLRPDAPLALAIIGRHAGEHIPFDVYTQDNIAKTVTVFIHSVVS